MLIFENIKLAFTSIRINKMRSFLTMLGMIIGISSVISIVSLGDTIRGVVAAEYENVGTRLAYSYIMAEGDYYTEKDLFSLEEVEKMTKDLGDNIDYISIAASSSGKIHNGRTIKDVSIQGLAENPEAYVKIKIVYGKIFSESDIVNGRKHIIIEDKTAKELFGVENAVGKTARIDLGSGIEEFIVTGIYENTDSALMKAMGGSSRYAKAYAPEFSIVSRDSPVWSIYVVSSEDIAVENFRNKFVRYVARMKGIPEERVGYYTAEEELSSMDSMMQTLSLVVSAIAAISLLVGGIGIMNIMLVSVTERTREIGIRKALGARTEDILFQFLIESAIISAAGGAIGTALGVGTIAIGGMAFGISAVVKPEVILLAVAFSAVVGIFFGLYPARKAAKADPIEALRYE